MKHSHIRTPRTMREAWGEDTRLATQNVDTIGHWLAALGIGVLIGLLLAWRG